MMWSFQPLLAAAAKLRNLEPTVALNSPADAGTTSDTTPDLLFTGTDAESDDIRYQVQLGQAFSNGYSYRKLVTQDETYVSGGADLSNVDVLYKVTDERLKSVGNGGAVQHASGYDIRFETTGGTKIDHRIIYWSATTGQLIARLKIPTLAYASSTEIYRYYGKSGLSSPEETDTAVYDSNYKFVADLKEDPSGSSPQINDETSNGYDMTSGGTMTSGDLIDGPIYKAIEFDGTDDYLVNTSWASVIDENDSFTMETWFNITTTPNVQFLAWGEAGTSNLCSIGIYGNSIGFLGYSNDHVVSAAPYDDGAWHKITITHNGTTVKVIIDGTEVLSESMTLGTNAGQDLYIGRWKDGGYAPAKLSDITISDNTRTNGWVITRYNSEKYPDLFWIDGEEEVFDVTVDVVSGTDAGFSGSPDNTDPFTSGQQVTYTVQSALSVGTYYWRVRGIDPSGSNGYGEWSTTRSFDITSGGYSIVASAGAFTLTGVAMSPVASRLITAALGTYTLTGVSAAFSKAFSLSASVGSFVLSGVSVGLSLSRLLAATKGTFTLTGIAISSLVSRVLTASQGTFTLSGIASTLSRIYSIIASTGTFSLTGISASTVVSRVILAVKGTFSLTGFSASFSRVYLMIASVGTFVITGVASGLVAARSMVASVGTFTLTGVSAAFAYTRTLIAGTGAFVLTGIAAVISKTGQYVLTAAKGTFAVTIRASATIIGRVIFIVNRGRLAIKTAINQYIEL